MPASDVLSRPAVPCPWRLVLNAAALSLIAAAPVAAQAPPQGPLRFKQSLDELVPPGPVAQSAHRAPVPKLDEFGWRQAEICGMGGSTPLVHSLQARSAENWMMSNLLNNSPTPVGFKGCVVPKTDRGPAFRLLIDASTGDVVTQPLQTGHYINRFEEWQKFKRTNPGGR
jgi:hypothetical protein